jgi:hypothetical protein
MKIRCSFLFLGVFCTSLANRVSNTRRNSEFLICNYEWLIIFYREGGLLSKLQHFKASNILWIKKATSVAVPSTMTNLEPNRNEQKTEKPKIHGYNKLFPEHLPLQPLGNFGQVAACRSSSANREIISSMPFCNRNSPQSHMKSELDALGVQGNRVSYVVHSSKQKNWNKNIFPHWTCASSTRPVPWPRKS